jgi:hypothetical protein
MNVTAKSAAIRKAVVKMGYIVKDASPDTGDNRDFYIYKANGTTFMFSVMHYEHPLTGRRRTDIWSGGNHLHSLKAAIRQLEASRIDR